eukprot:UN28190
MEFMTESGIEGTKLNEFISENPSFLTVSYKNLYWVKAFLEDDLGFDEVGSILMEVPELTLRTEQEVRANAEMLRHVGLDISETV